MFAPVFHEVSVAAISESLRRLIVGAVAVGGFLVSVAAISESLRRCNPEHPFSYVKAILHSP